MLPEITNKDEFEQLLAKNLVAIAVFIERNSDICSELIGRICLELIPNLREVKGVEIVMIPIDCPAAFADDFNINEVPNTLIFYKGQKVSFFQQGSEGKMYKTDRFMGNDPELPNKLFRFTLHLFRKYKKENQ